MIDHEKLIDICKKSLLKYDESKQLDKMMEECAELIVAIVKNRLNTSLETFNNVKEEMADVYLMIQQLTYIFGNIDDVINRKLKRHEKRLEE